jgi:hypothetical protein
MGMIQKESGDVFAQLLNEKRIAVEKAEKQSLSSPAVVVNTPRLCVMPSGLSLGIKIDDQLFWPIETNSGYRWTTYGAGFIGKHVIVKLMVDFDTMNRAMPSHEVMILESVVDALLDMLASGERLIDDEIERRDEIRKKRREEEIRKYMEQNQLTAAHQIANPEKRYVYLFRHSNGLTKIGFSKDPKNREKTLQAEDPRLNMLAFREGDSGLERRLHLIFASKRVRGEWFKLTELDVERIITICGFRIEWDA